MSDNLPAPTPPPYLPDFGSEAERIVPVTPPVARAAY